MPKSLQSCNDVVQHFASFMDITKHKEEEDRLQFLLDGHAHDRSAIDPQAPTTPRANRTGQTASHCQPSARIATSGGRRDRRAATSRPISPAILIWTSPRGMEGCDQSVMLPWRC